ncbi:dephospho-CoA kinase [Nonlabens ponticola]|uniref:Dephospho-CoA kinase n=1 Tax=Nonlabens ponticola TaxID=2496866 RepID=A0A3S9MY96_9FLAO|nr:dephospho-CoA kinase [Nonlabens ponticola]AZQ44023.1 dephospho-CoA kinase [Nonlabens ponticola]
MRIIGLTGGIGSGKTTVARMFEDLGVPLFIADDVSKTILATDLEARVEIKNLLGEQSFKTINDEVVPDKKYIASQVFTDQDKLQGLNRILHPRVRIAFEKWLHDQRSSFIIYEAAILFESGGDAICDEVILVTAPKLERISRVMKRDGSTKTDVSNRLQNQWNDIQRLEKSNYVIVNKDLQQTESFVKYTYDFLLKN